MKSKLYHLKINERGALVVCTEDGVQLPGINGIEVQQDIDMMKSGIAKIKVSLFVNTKENLIDQSTKMKDNESIG